LNAGGDHAFVRALDRFPKTTPFQLLTRVDLSLSATAHVHLQFHDV
jgi:hypothetical protein